MSATRAKLVEEVGEAAAEAWMSGMMDAIQHAIDEYHAEITPSSLRADTEWKAIGEGIAMSKMLDQREQMVYGGREQ